MNLLENIKFFDFLLNFEFCILSIDFRGFGEYFEFEESKEYSLIEWLIVKE